MSKQFNIREVLSKHTIIPVVNITDINKVESIIETLTNQSINCIEITLRSDIAFEAIAVRPSPTGIVIEVVLAATTLMDFPKSFCPFSCIAGPALSRAYISFNLPDEAVVV